uniref:Replication protein RepA n=1 Tax=Klebsiella pneumoniae TaxID=573 RepID=A0A2P1BPG6_KLEPN|nr:Replication protein RepA [Klebsiella pneumoniae]
MYKKSVDLSLESVLVEIDENKKLMPSRNATVQPVALIVLRSVSTSLKRKGKDTENISIDASSELQSLELARAEGYTDIRITGPRLSMETDFKVWVGIILAFSKYGLNSSTIELPFSEFATFCGV